MTRGRRYRQRRRLRPRSKRRRKRKQTSCPNSTDLLVVPFQWDEWNRCKYIAWRDNGFRRRVCEIIRSLGEGKARRFVQQRSGAKTQLQNEQGPATPRRGE